MKKLYLLFAALLSLSACNTSKKILYVQNMPFDSLVTVERAAEIKIQPQDQLSIVVTSRDLELSLPFNLPQANVQLGSSGSGKSSGNGGVLGYTVDASGNIDFPILGELHVEGLTRKELSVLVKERLVSSGLLKDPVVTVEFMNLYISVLGEVANPGRVTIQKDRITLLEALSQAGDLTIYGKRDGVIVIREDGDDRISYKVDLRDVSLFTSPAYYLQQNDVVYVEPNAVRAGQSTINENNMKSVSMWISIASFLMTLAMLIFK